MSRILKLVALSATFAVLAAFSGAAEARDCCKPAKIRCCKAPKVRCCQQTSCSQVITTTTSTAAAENSGQTNQMDSAEGRGRSGSEGLVAEPTRLAPS